MNRNIALDILKLIMALMVVGLHSRFLHDYNLLYEYLTVDGLFRIAVPVFFVINGFYFYPVLLKNNHLAWLKRVILLYIFWMLVYSYFWFYIQDFSFASFAKLIYKLIIGYHHLWYISGLIGAALLLVLLHKLTSFTISIFVILTFSIGVLIQYLGNYHVFKDTQLDTLFNYLWIHRNMFFFSFPFFTIGYLINKHSIQSMISFKTALLLTIISIIILIGESFINYYQESRDGGFDNFISLILSAPFLFILFIKSNISGNNKNIALYSSAIYFIHPLFIIIFHKFTNYGETSLTILTILTSFIASYFIIKINNKIKFIL